MLRIFKYQLPIPYGVQVTWAEIVCPPIWDILTVQLQGDDICLWAVVDAERQPQPYTFYLVGTGAAWAESLAYIGTVQVGEYVWHVCTFDLPERARRTERTERREAQAPASRSPGISVGGVDGYPY